MTQKRRPAGLCCGRGGGVLARAASHGEGRKGSGRVDDRKSSEHAAATAHPGGAVTTGRVLTLFCHRPAPVPVLAELSSRAARLRSTPPPRPPHAARTLAFFCEIDGEDGRGGERDGGWEAGYIGRGVGGGSRARTCWARGMAATSGERAAPEHSAAGWLAGWLAS